MQTVSIARRKAWQFAAVLLTATVAACGVTKQSQPGLVGPSEYTQSITLTATPDVLVQDGVSQTRVEVTARNAQSRPISGLAIYWAIGTSDGSYMDGNPSSITDANGRAVITVTAPPPPSARPTSEVTLRIQATPGGTDENNAVPRVVSVRLLPPEGTLPANTNPVAAFTIVPAVGSLNEATTFDAGSTMDEGAICGTRCTYHWDFGDFKHDTGVRVSHTYTLPGSYTVTLTVTDDRAGVSSSARTLTVNGPAAPVAQFTVAPTSPIAGANVTFNSSASTVGTGATLSKYFWDFGDGTTADAGAIPAYIKTGGYSTAGTYIVTLTVTDSLGRQATRTTTLTVQ